MSIRWTLPGPLAKGSPPHYEPGRAIGITYPNAPRFSETWEWEDDHWILKKPPHSPSARQEAKLAYDYNLKKVLLFGGVGASGEALNELWAWDGTDWRKIPMQQSWPGPRIVSTFISDPLRKRIVLQGGINMHNHQPYYPVYSDTWEWDGKKWTQLNSTPNPGQRYAALSTYDWNSKRVVVTRGRSGFLSYYDTTPWFWDGKSWASYKTKTKPPSNLYPTGSSFCWDFFARAPLLVLGFYDSYYGLLAENWHLIGGNWKKSLSMKTLNYQIKYGLLPDPKRNRILALGGVWRIGPKAPPTILQQRRKYETWAYDGKTWGPVAGATVTDPETGVSLIHDKARDQFLVLDKDDPKQRGWVTWDLGVFAYRGGRFVRLHPKTSPPASWTPYEEILPLYIDSLGKIFLHLGPNKPRLLPGTDWLWDGTNWTRINTVNRLDLHLMAAAYDRHRDRVVALAGDGSTWEWNLKTGWKKVWSSPRFNNLFYPTLAYDEVRRETVLFGAKAQGIQEDQTWIWNGKTWSQRFPKTIPPKRSAPRMLFLPEFGGIVMFGRNNYGSKDHTTWLWNGTDWRPLDVKPLEHRQDPIYIHRYSGTILAAAYDPGRHRILITYDVQDASPRSTRWWEFRFVGLSAERQELRPGERVRIHLDLPKHAGELAWLHLSGADWPGIPLGTYSASGRDVLPLAPDPIFHLNLAAPKLRRLDAQGRARFDLAFPPLRALAGLDLYTAAMTIGPTGKVTWVTNAERLHFNR